MSNQHPSHPSGRPLTRREMRELAAQNASGAEQSSPQTASPPQGQGPGTQGGGGAPSRSGGYATYGQQSRETGVRASSPTSRRSMYDTSASGIPQVRPPQQSGAVRTLQETGVLSGLQNPAEYGQQPPTYGSPGSRPRPQEQSQQMPTRSSSPQGSGPQRTGGQPTRQATSPQQGSGYGTGAQPAGSQSYGDQQGSSDPASMPQLGDFLRQAPTHGQRGSQGNVDDPRARQQALEQAQEQAAVLPHLGNPAAFGALREEPRQDFLPTDRTGAAARQDLPSRASAYGAQTPTAPPAFPTFGTVPTDNDTQPGLPAFPGPSAPSAQETQPGLPAFPGPSAPSAQESTSAFPSYPGPTARTAQETQPGLPAFPGPSAPSAQDTQPGLPVFPGPSSQSEEESTSAFPPFGAPSPNPAANSGPPARPSRSERNGGPTAAPGAGLGWGGGTAPAETAADAPAFPPLGGGPQNTAPAFPPVGGQQADGSPWPSVQPGSGPQAARPFGGAPVGLDDDDDDDDEEFQLDHSYTWLQYIILVAVALVLGMIIWQVGLKTPGANPEPQGEASAITWLINPDI